MRQISACPNKVSRNTKENHQSRSDSRAVERRGGATQSARGGSRKRARGDKSSTRAMAMAMGMASCHMTIDSLLYVTVSVQSGICTWVYIRLYGTIECKVKAPCYN